MSRFLCALCLVAFIAVAPASAATGRTARTTTRRATTPAVRPHTPAAVPATAARPGSAARTLDDIHIEGEIPVPQVLFITARDQRRFLEFQPNRYLRSSRQLAEATLPPGWIVVTRNPITPAEEISR